MTGENGCALCGLARTDALWADDRCLVVAAQVPGVGTICRVVWRDHVREMSDLGRADRHALMDVVFGVETALRRYAQPEKMNLASLGNLVPHLHWHVMPRYRDDAYFPDSIWANARRETSDGRLLAQDGLQSALTEILGSRPKPPL
ncbi:HIT family protein [Acidiphilium sp.]|uniref:HIT family protein n=1 Tax=Acidiphilium sp. TaxID=527 RepID=UPI002590A6E5|nr:HIT family protein [Acidiphilium sp.]